MCVGHVSYFVVSEVITPRAEYDLGSRNTACPVSTVSSTISGSRKGRGVLSCSIGMAEASRQFEIFVRCGRLCDVENTYSKGIDAYRYLDLLRYFQDSTLSAMHSHSPI